MVKDAALAKLVNVMGPVKAQALIDETLARIGLQDLKTPDDRLKFACALMEKGGVIEAIGRAIKIQAFLHGAKDR